ncbi:MAG: efflux RND transporter periplasmic adaptor subunit [Bacteroidales bacterium]|nr:efflux RND transporter periplasmic adaptor subunit [Bacteroidota bacterium]MBL6949628.1 efflux RND transporter periplasmic adaptor subunit [Bacteroidales bacterium]
MKKLFAIIALLSLVLAGCQDRSTQAAADSQDNESLSYTIFSEDLELFVEFPTLIVGESTTFITHFTKLGDYKPLQEGELTLSLTGPSTQSIVVEGPVRPGIFEPTIIPGTPGIFNLSFTIETETLIVEFIIEDLEVFADDEAAVAYAAECADHDQGGGGISFLKEQAWKIDFETQPVEASNFQEIIKTTGKILPAQGDEYIITARHGGIVVFRKYNIFSGNKVRKGESLFNLSASGLVDDNIKEQYLQTLAKYEKSKANYTRNKSLVKDQLITESEFLESKYEFEIDSNAYQVILKNYLEGGAEIRSPETGFIQRVYVSEGEFVEQGQPLASISLNQNLIIEADVPQQYFHKLGFITSANIETPYDNKIYDIDKLNGRLISYGRNTDPSGLYTPIYFQIKNPGKLIPGSFIEVFLKAKPVRDAIVIPRTAIIEEFGNYYVYIQTGGETYEKSEVTIANDDGIHVMIREGLHEDDRVVTKGAYRIKLASMSSDLPSHGHVH